MKNKVLALLIALVMMMPVQVVAAASEDIGQTEADSVLTEAYEEDQGEVSQEGDQEDAQSAETEVPEEVLAGESSNAGEEEVTTETDNTEGQQVSDEWTAADFIFEDKELIDSAGENVSLAPATDTLDKLNETVHVITGFSESGEAKLGTNTDLVIPAADADGIPCQGIWKAAFKDKGITSLELPSGITTANSSWDESVETRGDFFIGYEAFRKNALTSLALPEGVIYIGTYAFAQNSLTSVSFPSTLMLISSYAFASNSITSLTFTETTDFPLQIDAYAFMSNQIESVKLPEETSKVTENAFRANTGTDGSGKVTLYVTDPGEYVVDSDYQTIVAEQSSGQGGEDPETVEWTSSDFTFDTLAKYGEEGQRLYGCDYQRDFTIKGIVVTGFSESGETKLASNTDIVIPAKDTDGNKIVGVGPSAFKGKGLTSVTLPTGMLVSYDDTLTNRITKRGNFVICEYAFANNELTEVYLPDGVIAIMAYAFSGNDLTKVTLPKTIWWIENVAFARNKIETVRFPETTYFQLEMHGMPFAYNNIKTVRLPDYTRVVNKNTFMANPGVRDLTDEELHKAFTSDSGYQNALEDIEAGVKYGMVSMYTDAVDLADLDRIHHYDQQTESTKSYFQRLIINDGTPETQYQDETAWNINDFTLDGTVVTGLSESGIAKRAVNKDLVIPDYTADYDAITGIAAAEAGKIGGLFATEDETFNTITLPSGLKYIGDYAFRESGITDVAFPPELESIGMAAFQMNQLTSVILPDTVTSVGPGAFASNKTIERIDLSTGLTEITEGAFGCSDMKNWMTDLTEIEIPEGITKIGQNAFAGNNFSSITIPDGVTEIGEYAFSTKNYLLTQQTDHCELILPDSLVTIGDRAFRNKNIAEVYLPESVTGLAATTFEKKLSTHGNPVDPGSEQYDLVTKVIITNSAQSADTENFPASDYHTLILVDKEWETGDFSFEEGKVTGLTEDGENKLLASSEVTVPAVDTDGNAITEIAESAFDEEGITEITIEEGISTIGANAFSGNDLSKAEFPATIESIGEQAFADNDLTWLVFDEKTSTKAASSASGLSIGARAFANNKLMSVQLPEGTDTVNGTAFIGNTGLKAITSGTDEEKAGGLVLMYIQSPGSNVACLSAGTSNVQDLIADQDEPDRTAPWAADDFSYESGGTVINGLSYSGLIKMTVNKNLVIPESSPEGTEVTGIADEAFAVDESLVDVGKYDYNTDGGIETVTLTDELESIGDRAFIFNSIRTVNFEDAAALASIGETAFKGNKLQKVHLTDSVTSLGAGAFAANNIVDIRLPHNEQFTVIPNALFSMNIRMSSVEIPDTIVEIGEMAFAGARLETLEIPASVRKIDRKAFHLHHLSTLTIPGNVEEICESAFEGTYKEQTLKTLVLEEGVRKIGKYAFKEGLLTTVDLPLSLEELGTEPFLNNKGTDDDHVVLLRTDNPDHFAFNEGARTHKVVDKVITATPEIVLSPTDFAYTGKTRKPSVKVLVNGEELTTDHYTVTGHTGKKAIGQYTVKVTLKEGYKGSNTAVFRINPKNISLSKISKGSKRLTVKWKKASRADQKLMDGYQLRYSMDKKFKTGVKTVKAGKTAYSKTIKGLKAKKTYYVQIRRYKKVGGKTLYSAWSKSKYTKTK